MRNDIVEGSCPRHSVKNALGSLKCIRRLLGSPTPNKKRSLSEDFWTMNEMARSAISGTDEIYTLEVPSQGYLLHNATLEFHNPE